MVRGLVDIPEDEFDVPKIPDARVCPRVHELRAIEVHADDVGAGGRGDEREAPLSCPEVQDASPANVFVPELIEEHRAEGFGLRRRLPPRPRTAHAHDVAYESPEWRELDPSKRGRLLWLLGQQVRDHFDDLSRLESQNVGKPLREAKGDIAYVYKLFEYYAGLADKIQGDTIPVPGSRFD